MLASLAREATARGLDHGPDEQPLDPPPSIEELAFANVLYSVRDGLGIKRIAENHGVSRGALMLWLIHADGKLTPEARQERKQALSHAREESAAALEDDVLAIADDATPEDASVARVRMAARQWLAGVRAPQQYGKGGPQVHISLGQLHLHALKNTPAPVQLRPDVALMLPSNVSEAHIVSEDSATG